MCAPRGPPLLLPLLLHVVVVVARAGSAAGGSYEIVRASGGGGPAAINRTILPGAGGQTGKTPWDGYAAVVDGAGPAFRVYGPVGGCGHKSKTSANAKAHGCRYATNGGPFDVSSGACSGLIVSEGAHLNGDYGGVSFGVAMRDGGGQPSWVIGSFNASEAAAVNLTEAVEGFGWSVRNGSIVPGPGGPLAPRTAVGTDAAGRLVLLEVDGCEHCPTPQGMTDYAVAEALLGLGVVHAINLDGGGSSTTAVDGKVVNYPTSLDQHVKWERQVSTITCVL